MYTLQLRTYVYFTTFATFRSIVSPLLKSNNFSCQVCRVINSWRDFNLLLTFWLKCFLSNLGLFYLSYSNNSIYSYKLFNNKRIHIKNIAWFRQPYALLIFVGNPAE